MARVLIVTPAGVGSHRGNRITALRWTRMLRQLGQHAEVTREFADQRCDWLLALHARKSARSIRRFASKRSDAPLVVALTGTDLYRDIRTHATARKSLALATRLLLLQPHGIGELPDSVRDKVSVIFQSAVPPTRRLPPLRSTYEVCVAGHLRYVKDPFRAAMAARLLPASSRIRITHVGAALTDAMARRARLEMARNRRYHWLGDVAASRARQLIGRARVLVLSSRMEGGANVLCEALVAGVPVLASRISGSIGMLGEEYGGYFTVGQTRELAQLMCRCENDSDFYGRLRKQCVQRAKLFQPGRELAAWRKLLKSVGVQ